MKKREVLHRLELASDCMDILKEWKAGLKPQLSAKLNWQHFAAAIW